MDSDTERQLVERLQAGDAAAFDLVHAAFHDRLFNFLARLTRNRDVAEDLLEETWLRFVRHAGRLRPDTQLGPWLFTVARHVHVSYWRARAVEETAMPSIGLWPGGPASSPFELAAASEFERRLEAALLQLPTQFREVLLLVAIEGLRPAEAAVVCGISQEALRQRLKRARRMLARLLDDDGLRSAPVAQEVRS